METGLIISIMGCAITVLSFFGIGGIFSHKVKKALAFRDEQEQKIVEYDRKEHVKEIQTIIKDEIQPLQNKIDNIQENLQKNSNGVLASLRNDIIQCYNRCKNTGYTTTRDRSNFHDMVDAYHKLGGNSYITQVAENFDALPHDKKGE